MAFTMSHLAWARMVSPYLFTSHSLHNARHTAIIQLNESPTHFLRFKPYPSILS